MADGPPLEGKVYSHPRYDKKMVQGFVSPADLLSGNYQGADETTLSPRERSVISDVSAVIRDFLENGGAITKLTGNILGVGLPQLDLDPRLSEKVVQEDYFIQTAARLKDEFEFDYGRFLIGPSAMVVFVAPDMAKKTMLKIHKKGSVEPFYVSGSGNTSIQWLVRAFTKYADKVFRVRGVRESSTFTPTGIATQAMINALIGIQQQAGSLRLQPTL